MQEIQYKNISIDTLSLPLLKNKNIEVSILRLDKIHPIISGNKWFKLRFYLEEAKRLDKKKILTFGGAWSNHLLATSAICQLNNLESIGIIRGEASPNPSLTLQRAKEFGMQLFFISREDYHTKKIADEILAQDFYLINEGGYGELGAAGASTIMDLTKSRNYTHVCCAAGTGTMAAGITTSSKSTYQTIAISVLKNYFDLEKNISSLNKSSQSGLLVNHDYHFGGYAKYTNELIDFMNEFYKSTAIPTDFVYTGKLFYGIIDMIQSGYFTPGDRLLIIHSGGLQGNLSLNKGTLIF